MLTDTALLPPISIDSERLLLSCCLQDRDVFLECLGIVTASMFYDLRNATVWTEMERRDKAGEPVSALEVSTAFKGDDRLYAFQLGDLSPSPVNYPHYLAKVIEAQQKRNVIHGCSEVDGMARNGHTLAEIAEASERLLAVDIKAPPVLSGRESALILINDLEARHQLNGKLSGIDTGFPDLNEMNEGFQAGEMSVIGARPSIGKTALGLMFFSHAVFDLKIPALFYSLEMSTAAIMRRMLAMESRIGLKELRKGGYTDAQMKQFTMFQVKCKNAPMHIIDSTSPGIAEVCATIRRAVRKHGIKLVVVDYLQKIKASEKNEKRTYEVAEVSSRLKGVAKQLGISVVALAQLNRENEKEKGRLPRLTDLADSGQIERDADLVGLLDRNRNEPCGPATLLIAKQRDGETGVVNLTFLGQFGRFESATRQEIDTNPNHNDP